METINVIDKNFNIPKEFQTDKGFICTQHRVKEIHQGRNITIYMRHPPEKPYIEEGFVEFKLRGKENKPKRYKFVNYTTGQLLDFALSNAKVKE